MKRILPGLSKFVVKRQRHDKGHVMAEEFPELVGDHVPRMYRVALRIVADPDRAQDVVQDACLKALKAIGKFDGRSSLATWLHKITVNCARDQLRAETCPRKNIADLDGLLLASLPTLDMTPAMSAEIREMQDIAWQFVQQLPDDCRSAFILTQLDGYSYDEAAVIEDQPRGTMASRVFRAKKILLGQMKARANGRTET